MGNTHITNYSFKRILGITGIRDIELIKEIFAIGGYSDIVTRAKIDRWQVIKNNENRQPMPNEALEAFLGGLLTLSEQDRLICYVVNNNG